MTGIEGLPKRMFFGTVGICLLVLPALIGYSLTIPVPRFRTGTFADYRAFVLICGTVYGGAALGYVIQWRHKRMRIQSARDVFRACFVGALAMAGLGLGVGSVMEGGPGNLWGLVVIVGALLAALVGGGSGLLWKACQRV